MLYKSCISSDLWASLGLVVLSYPGRKDGAALTPSQRDAFDILYEEGEEGEPKMMTVILHPPIIGRAGRAASLEKFLAYSGSTESESESRVRRPTPTCESERVKVQCTVFSVQYTYSYPPADARPSAVSEKPCVWVAKRSDIADHWKKHFPYDPAKAFGQTKVAPCY